LGAFRGSEPFRTMILNHLQNLGNHIRILRLVQNARNVEHAVLEELDSVFLGFLLLDSTTNLVSGAFASPQDALLFDFEQGLLNRELVQQNVRVHSVGCANQDHHGGQCGSVHSSQGSTGLPIRFSKPWTEPSDSDR
jgi:hypothetical protein